MAKKDISYYTPCAICGKNFPVYYYGKGYRGSLCSKCRVMKNAGHLRRKKKRLTIGDIKELNRKAGQHWFSPDTMKFFKSKVPDDHMGLVGNRFFISSEKNPFGDPRAFSIREWRGKTKDIATYGEFQQFKTKAQAKRVLEKLMAGKI